MKPTEKQYTIYIRSKQESIPVTKEEFDNYYRDINAYRRKQMDHERCFCPRSQWLSCDMDCFSCPFHLSGDLVSIDVSNPNEDTNSTWIDSIPDEAPPVEDYVTEANEFKEALQMLTEIMPDAIKIGVLREQGLSDSDIAREIGIPRTTLLYQLKKAKELLKSDFPEIF